MVKFKWVRDWVDQASFWANAVLLTLIALALAVGALGGLSLGK